MPSRLPPVLVGGAAGTVAAGFELSGFFAVGAGAIAAALTVDGAATRPLASTVGAAAGVLDADGVAAVGGTGTSTGAEVIKVVESVGGEGFASAGAVVGRDAACGAPIRETAKPPPPTIPSSAIAAIAIVAPLVPFFGLVAAPADCASTGTCDTAKLAAPELVVVPPMPSDATVCCGLAAPIVAETEGATPIGNGPVAPCPAAIACACVGALMRAGGSPTGARLCAPLSDIATVCEGTTARACDGDACGTAMAAKGASAALSSAALA